MIYGTVLSYRSFISMDSALYDEQKKALKEWARTNPVTTFRRIYPFVPLPFERSSIALSFVLCLTVGIAVVIILVFHIYLILTAQTTIEFHGNWVKKAQCKLRKIPFKYPYSLGWKRNLQQVFGSGMVILWFLPSIREPEFLPIPLKGDKGVRERIRLAYFVESNRLEPSKSEDHDSQV
jgi:palmitoyltransferase